MPINDYPAFSKRKLIRKKMGFMMASTRDSLAIPIFFLNFLLEERIHMPGIKKREKRNNCELYEIEKNELTFLFPFL